MKERGQVFTLDMLFALILVATFVALSGQALEIASGQTRSYSTRYSLERIVNDAADALVKTVGDPPNWAENVESLETLGLAENSPGNEKEAVQNILDIRKLVQLRDLLRAGNWDPAKDEVKAVMSLFEGTDKFEIKMIYKEVKEVDGEIVVENVITFWDIWPDWDVENSSGAENALEVVVVKRPVFLKLGMIEVEAIKLVHKKVDPDVTYYPFENFSIKSGELDAYDWYIIVEPSDPETPQPNVKIEVNDNIQEEPDSDIDYKYERDGSPFSMRYHGLDNELLTDDPGDVPLQIGNNFLSIGVWGKPTESADIYVIAVAKCSSIETVKLAVESPLTTLELKVWR